METSPTLTGWLGIAALALIVAREAILLAAGFYKKRRNGSSGERSVEFWQDGGQAYDRGHSAGGVAGRP